MKVTYIHQYYNNPSMEGGTRSYEFARRLVGKGHEVNLITSYRKKTSCTSWFVTNDDGIQVHWIPISYSNEFSFFRRIKAFLKFSILASKKASSIDADIIFGTSTPLTIAIPAVIAKRKLQIPLVFEVRDLWPEIPIAIGAIKSKVLIFLDKLLEKFAYNNSDAIIALSPDMKSGIIAKGYNASKIGVIPNCSNLTQFEADPLHCDEFKKKRKWIQKSPILLYAGTFGLINGVSYMVDLAVLLKELGSNIKILLIGSGLEVDEVTRLSKNNVYQENIFIEKALSKKDVAIAYNVATCCSSLFIDLPEMRANSNKFSIHWRRENRYL